MCHMSHLALPCFTSTRQHPGKIYLNSLLKAINAAVFVLSSYLMCEFDNLLFLNSFLYICVCVFVFFKAIPEHIIVEIIPALCRWCGSY